MCWNRRIESKKNGICSFFIMSLLFFLLVNKRRRKITVKRMVWYIVLNRLEMDLCAVQQNIVGSG